MKEDTMVTTNTPAQPAENCGCPTETRDTSRTLTPPVDIFELSEGLAVVVDMPGVEKDGVELHVENDVLTIKGQGKNATPGDITYKEFELTTYFRQFQLGEQVDQEKIKADLRNGVLTIHLPKVEKAKPKKISVNISS